MEGSDVDVEVEGEKAERLSLEAEGDVIRKLIDPKLPSQDEVNRHNLMGHVEYRNWWAVCVRAR